MANRLVLSFLFVMLAGGFMGTCVQDTNMTTAASTSTAPTTASGTATTASRTATTASGTATTASGTATTASTAPTTASGTATTASGTATTASAALTTASGTVTTASRTATTASGTATTASGTATTASTAPTTASGTATTASAALTTASGTVTTASGTATTASGTATTANVAPTTASGTTSTTTTPSITPNSTVTNLTETIFGSNCSKTQLCARQPSDCDPTTGTGCFFLGVRQQSGQNFGVALSRDSDGYIAAILSRNTTLGNNDTTYICAKNNGAVKYFSAFLNNGKLTTTTLPVNNVRGKVNGNKIECTFDATVPDSSTRAAASYSLSVATGTYSASNDSLGNPTPKITTNPVDLTNVTAPTNNQLANTTTTTTAVTPTVTTNNAVTIQQSLMQALLITVGVLSLTIL